MKKFLSIFIFICISQTVLGDSLFLLKDTDHIVTKRDANVVDTVLKPLLQRIEQMMESSVDTLRGIVESASNLPPPFNTIISAKGMPLVDAMEKVLDTLRDITKGADESEGLPKFHLPTLPNLFGN